MDNQLIMSRKQFRKMLMPHIGDVFKIESGSFGKIIYVNEGQLRFSFEGKATMDEIIEIDNKLFKVNRINNTKINAGFIGFKANPESKIELAPEEPSQENIVKVID